MVPVAALVVLLVLPTVPAGADTLGTTNVGSNMTLTEDHDGNIVIVTDNVTLDCDGHAIKGDGVGDGINLAYRTGVTVRNCVILDFAVGLRLQHSDGNVVEGNTANKSTAWGFIIGESSAGNLLVDNKAVQSGLDGFALFNHDTDDNELVGNAATNNARYGYVTSGAPEGNLFVDNKARNNGDVGFLIQSTWDRGSTLRDNDSVNNGGVGFMVSSNFPSFPAHNNELNGNKATNNAGPGFALANADDNIFEDNWSQANSDGFAFWVSARSNTLIGNTANRNGNVGFGITGFANHFEGNVANHNGFDGFGLVNADNNTFIGNEASHNEFVGFRVFDWPPPPEPSDRSDGNFFDSNTGCHNGEWDAEDSTTRGTNNWISNEFCTTLGI